MSAPAAQNRQRTYIGNTLTLDDIGHGRKVTTVAQGKEKIHATYDMKPVKTDQSIKNISEVRLPKHSVAVGQLDLGKKVTIEEPNAVIKYVEKEVPVEEIVYKQKEITEYVDVDVPEYYDEQVVEDIPVETTVFEDVNVEEYVDKIITVHKSVPKTVERKIPVTLTIPKIIKRDVEKVIEVPNNEIIHKEVKVIKEKVNHKRQFNEKKVPIVVSNHIEPIVQYDPDIVREVDVVDHYPIITPVDVHIAKPVNINVRAVGTSQVTHKVVTVPAAHYNTLLKKMNPGLNEDLPLFMEDGVIPLLNQELSFLYPPADAEIEGFNAYEAAYAGINEDEYLSGSGYTSSMGSKSSSKTTSSSARYASSYSDKSGMMVSAPSTAPAQKPQKKCLVC